MVRYSKLFGNMLSLRWRNQTAGFRDTDIQAHALEPDDFSHVPFFSGKTGNESQNTWQERKSSHRDDSGYVLHERYARNCCEISGRLICRFIIICLMADRFFYFPKFIRSFMAGKFMEIGDLARGKSKEEAVSSIMNHKFAKKLKESSPDFYCGMLDSFTEIFQWIDRDSVRRIADTCYKCDLPAFDEEQIRRFTFLYSKNEPARKAEIRLRRKYPNAEYLIMKSRGHGGFQAERPEEYAELMRNEAGCGKG